MSMSTHVLSGVRAAIIAAAVLMVALVGASRIYLGVHYASDVLAAVAESCGWLAVCITASSTLRRRRAALNQRRCASAPQSRKAS